MLISTKKKFKETNPRIIKLVEEMNLNMEYVNSLCGGIESNEQIMNLFSKHIFSILQKTKFIFEEYINGVSTGNKKERMLNLIKLNPYISCFELSKTVGCSLRHAERIKNVGT